MQKKYLEIYGLLAVICAYLILSGSGHSWHRSASVFSSEKTIDFPCEYCPNFGAHSSVPQV